MRSGAAASSSPAEVDELVLGFHPNNKFAAAHEELLASQLEIDPATARALQQVLALATNPFDAFRQLQVAAALARSSCLAPESFAQATATGTTELNRAVAALRRALPLKFRDAGELARRTAAIDDRLLTLEDTVEFFNLVLKLKLTTQEKQDLTAFMRAL